MPALPGLIGLLGDDDAELKADLIAYQAGITGWPQAAVPASADIVASIAKLLATLDQAITDIESKQGDHTYIKAKAKIGCWSYKPSGTLRCAREMSWGSSSTP